MSPAPPPQNPVCHLALCDSMLLPVCFLVGVFIACPPQVKGFHSQNHEVWILVHAFGRSDCSFKHADISARMHKEHDKSGKPYPPKEHRKLSVIHAKEMEIHKLPGKEFKIIILKRFGKLVRERTQIKDLTKSGKQYNNKMRSSTKRKKTHRIWNSGADGLTCNRELQQQTRSNWGICKLKYRYLKSSNQKRKRKKERKRVKQVYRTYGT